MKIFTRKINIISMKNMGLNHLFFRFISYLKFILNNLIDIPSLALRTLRKSLCELCG